MEKLIGLIENQMAAVKKEKKPAIKVSIDSIASLAC